jgi:DNA-directed RNA polymerase specialized sigma24 family protein
VDEALGRLKQEDPELERIVVMKFFGGLSNTEIAESLGLANRTLDRQWAYARAWLFRTISDQM